MKLYSFWRSQAAYRVRIALALKGIEVERETIDLIKGEQHDPAYRAVNPEAVVPTLVLDDGTALFQSIAIIDYLDQTHPEPPLFPGDALARARCKALAFTLAGDVHPLIVPRVRKHLAETYRQDEAGIAAWMRHWMDLGSQAFEEMLARSPDVGRFCCGDRPTLADLCLVPHFVSASHAYEFDLDAFPRAARIYRNCLELDAFAATHPSRQPGAPQNH